MKSPRALVFALVCGLIALGLSYYYLSQRDRSFQEKYGAIDVAVAAKNIERFDILRADMLTSKKIPKDFAEPDAVLSKDAGKVYDMVAETTIYAGSQITLTKVSAPSEALFSVSIPKDSRACTVAVNEISGVAGLIRPGDHIDLVGTFKSLDEKSRAANQVETMTLFQNVQVLSVGRNYMFESNPPSPKAEKALFSGGAGGGASNVTVAMTPRECMDLTVAQQVGVLTVMLRSYLDRFGGKAFKELKDQHSTAVSVTGIRAPLEISKAPKWLEIRGEHATMVP